MLARGLLTLRSQTLGIIYSRQGRKGREPYYAPDQLRGEAPKGARGGREGCRNVRKCECQNVVL